MVVYVLDENLQHVRTIRLWRGEFGTAPPFDIGHPLFVAYSAWAELTCFMVLGWKFPSHVFDLHTAYLAASNILLPYNPDEMRKRSASVCPTPAALTDRRLGTDRQGDDSKDIGEGRWRDYGKKPSSNIAKRTSRNPWSCSSRNCAACKRFQRASVEHVLHWSNYSAKAVAQIQAKGMPIDMWLWNLVQENKAAIIARISAEIRSSQGTEHPIYTPRRRVELRAVRALAGQASASSRGHDLKAAGSTSTVTLSGSCITSLESRSCMLSATVSASSCAPSFRSAATAATGQALSLLHRYWPQCSRQKLVQCACQRPVFHGFPADTIGVYLDWRTQEVGIAAALSGDEALMADYREGDVYYGLRQALRPNIRPRS